MRKLLMASAVSLGVISIAAVGSASAADLSPAVPPPLEQVPGSAPIVNWQGFHVGVNGGYAWAKADAEFGSGASGATDLNLAGWLAGGQIGYDWQTVSGLVFGVEADYDWAKITGSHTGPGAGGGTATITETINSFGTVRARLGKSVGRWLPYVTAGAAFGTATRHQVVTGGPVFDGSVDRSYMGWTAGTGLEYAINDHVSIRGQYLYADLGKQNFDLPAPGGQGTDVHLTASIATLGLNVRF